MRVGSITVDGAEVGAVYWSSDGSDGVDGNVNISDSLSGHPAGFEPTAKSHGASGRSHHPSHHYRSHDSIEHKETPEEHKHNSIRYGHHVNKHENIPHTSGGNPFDRTRFDKELKEKPWLKEKIAHIALGENQDKKANLAVIESMMNRAVVRGTSLEAQAKRHRSSGVDEHGYYAGYAKSVGADERAMFEHNLGEALGHTGHGQSNISNYATDNASGGLAARESKSGAFVHQAEFGGEHSKEHFFSPGNAEPVFRDRWNKLHSQATAFEKNKRNTNAEGRPQAVTSPEGQKGNDVAAFIVHHTGGRGTPEGVQNTLRQRGLGVEYIMDREGNISVAGGRGASHMKKGWGAGSGLSNRNTVGMEIIAKNNADVTPKQVEAARAFIEKNYPHTPVYGHGEVNPGHKEADEGRAVVNAVRNQRAMAARADANKSPPPEESEQLTPITVDESDR